MSTTGRKSWKQKTNELFSEIHVLYFAVKDPRTPWYVKSFAFFILLYAISPIDLIPDFIPVIGLLDDLVIVPLGILAIRKMIPKELLDEYRQQSKEKLQNEPGLKKKAMLLIISLWIVLLTFLTFTMYQIAK